MSDVARFFAMDFEKEKARRALQRRKMLVNLMPREESGEGSAFRGCWQWFILALIMLPSCLMKAAVPLVLGKGRAG